MNQLFTLPVLVMGAATVIALLVSLYTLRWRASPGGIYFLLLMMAVAIYSFTNAAEQAALSVSTKVLWSKISYLGIVSVSPLWFLFAEEYSHKPSRMTLSQVAALWFLPAVTLGLAATNEQHRLVWSTITETSGSVSRLIYSHGIWFWIHAAYAYILLLAGTYLLVRVAWRSPQLFRWQVIAILTAALIPWVANLLYLLEINPWPGLDLTPLGFLLTGLIIFWAIFRFQMLDLVPIARDILFESIGDGVIVLDKGDRIVDLNPTARDWMNAGNKAIGSHISSVVQINDVIAKYESVMETKTKLEIKEGETRRIFDLTISPLRDARGNVHGRFISLHDISREYNLLESERLRSRQMERLNAITEVALSMPDLNQMLQELADKLAEIFAADGAYLTLWNDEQGRAIPAAAHGVWREKYPSLITDRNERTVTESTLQAGHALVIEDAFNTPYMSPRIAARFPTRSLLALPLILDDQKLGAVIISFNQEHHFTPEEISLGEQVARQIALAMIKIKLYEAEKKRATQLAALQTISQIVISSLDLKQIFETVVSVLQDTFGYHYVSIYHLEDEILRLGTQRGSPDDTVFEEISIHRGVAGRAVRTGQPQFVPDVAADPAYLRINQDIESEICVPLIKDQTVFGILNVEASARHPLSKSDVSLLTTFANQVAVAIDNARLFKAEKEQRDLAEALREVGIALSESLDFETVLERLLEEILGVIPYDRAFVMLLNKKGDRARIARLRILKKYHKETESKTITLEYELSKMANLKEMAKTGKPLAIPDTKTDPIWKSTASLSLVRSWVGAPISFKNRVTGFLSLDSLKPGFYHHEHAESLALFARQAALSIENARLFTETQKQARKERLLSMATRDFSARLGEEAVFQAIVRHMTNALNIEGCAISRWDPVNNYVETLNDYASTPGFPLDKPGTIYPLVDYPLTRAAIKQQQPMSIHIDDPLIDFGERALLMKYKTDSLLLLPLIIGQGKQVFGIVELYGKAGAPPFSKDELELAQNLVTHAATAIENARLYAEVQRLAIVDELTGLYNRRGFYEIGKREWERANRLNRPVALLFLDIDHFKQFNDIYSYAIGDQVLRNLADCLRDNLRKVDIAGRYGGEEFVVLLPETGLHFAGEVAERLRITAKNISVKTDLDEANFTISIGVCQKTPDLADLDALIECAGEALHQAKRGGRNRVILSAISEKETRC